MRLLTADDIADALQVSTYRAYEMLRRQELPAIYVGRLVRAREEDLRAFIERGGHRHRTRNDGNPDPRG